MYKVRPFRASYAHWRAYHFKTRITNPNFVGICLSWIYEIHRNILLFSEIKIWNFNYLRKSPNESYHQNYFWTSVLKKCVPQILTSDNRPILRSCETSLTFCEVWKNVCFAEAKQRHPPPVCCCYLSLTRMEIHSMTMELDSWNMDFVEISS